MKHLLLFTLLSSSTLFAHTITVNISNISNTKGDILIGLYNSTSSFTTIDKVYKNGKIELSKQNIGSYTFKNIPDGTYAISLFHDENSNNKLDKNFLGIPKEGYGFSNNIRPAFRSATFEESKFKLYRDISLTIRLGY